MAKGGRPAKAKGYKGEKELERLLQEAGIPAERMPLSGSLGGKYAGDVQVWLDGEVKRIQVKRRRDGFKELYKWLEQHDLLCIRADRREWLVVMRLGDWVALVRGEKGEQRL